MDTTNDTSADAETVQLELLRAMTPAQRFNLMASMTHDAIVHSKRAIQRANPDLIQRDLDLIFIEVHYGKTLADDVRKCLEERNNDGIRDDSSTTASR